MLTYVNGSKSDGRRYRVPVRWIGLSHADVARYALPRSALQAMSTADVAKAASLARDPYVSGSGTPLAAALRDEAALFGESRVKMELEGLLGRGLDFITRSYLPDKLARRDWVDAEGDGADDYRERR